MSRNITLRPLHVEDAAAMTDVLSAPELYTYIGGEPPALDELTRRYTVQSRGYSLDRTEEWLNFIVLLEPQAEPIGYVQATISTLGDPTQVAWVIGKPWQGQGYATRAAALLLDDLAGRGIGEVVAHIHPDNEASNRLVTRLGFVPTDTVIDGEIRWHRRLKE